MTIFHDLDRALRWLRLQHRRKQCEVAQAAGITQAMLCSYEKGKRQPSLRTLEKILDSLGVDLPGLFRVLETVREQPVASDESEFRAPSTAHAGQPRSMGKAADPLAPARSASACQTESEIDLHRWLGLSHRLPVEQEEALSQMLEGFLTWLRLLHAAAATANSAVSSDDPPTLAHEK